MKLYRYALPDTGSLYYGFGVNQTDILLRPWKWDEVKQKEVVVVYPEARFNTALLPRLVEEGIVVEVGS